MNELEKKRKQIDNIDQKMLKLFVNRMHIAKEIGQIKKNQGLDIYQPLREKELIDSLTKKLNDQNLEPYYLEFITKMISLSKNYQNEKIMPNIYMDHNILKNIKSLFQINSKALIISDSQIPKQYIDTVSKSLTESSTFIIPAGEENKNLDNLRKILEFLIEHEYDRSSVIIGLGGGVVCDIANLASSLFMRGIKCYLVPTSLLAMCDAAIGGKNAVDMASAKNQVGTFKMPNGILIDFDTLNTLDERLFNEGMAEVIKIAATSSKELYDLIMMDNANIDDIIKKAVELKCNIVSQDVTDQGLRNILNFGHTFGHAAEAFSKGKYLHGECVAMGMGYFVRKDAKEKIRKALEKYHLPSQIPYSFGEIKEFINHDKKKQNQEIRIVFVDEIGTSHFEMININDLEKYYIG